MRQKSIVMSPAEPETKKDCADEGQQQFTRPTDQIAHIKAQITQKARSKTPICTLYAHSATTDRCKETTANHGHRAPVASSGRPAK
jgi:hypothetical protein